MKIFSRKKKGGNGVPVTDILTAGTRTPEFKLENTEGKSVRLKDYLGQPIILAFYPGDWSPVCGAQMILYNEVLPLFEEHKAQLLGISVDSKWSHLAYTEANNLRFPLLADFEPKGEVSRRFGAYDQEKGASRRALFVIDAQGVITWSEVSPNYINPGANGILEALEKLPS